MDLKSSYNKRRPLTPKDDWDLIYQEALEAINVLYKAKNKAQVKSEQLLNRKKLFFSISIILWIVSTIKIIKTYWRNG